MRTVGLNEVADVAGKKKVDDLPPPLRQRYGPGENTGSDPVQALNRFASGEKHLVSRPLSLSAMLEKLRFALTIKRSGNPR
jgi:hypothetical protein